MKIKSISILCLSLAVSLAYGSVGSKAINMQIKDKTTNNNQLPLGSCSVNDVHFFKPEIVDNAPLQVFSYSNASAKIKLSYDVLDENYEILTSIETNNDTTELPQGVCSILSDRSPMEADAFKYNVALSNCEAPISLDKNTGKRYMTFTADYKLYSADNPISSATQGSGKLAFSCELQDPYK